MKTNNLKLLLKDLDDISPMADKYRFDSGFSDERILELQLETAYENIDKLKDIIAQLINYLDGNS